MNKNKNVDLEKVDFDIYAGDYEKLLNEKVEFFGEEIGYFAEYKIKLVKDTLEVNPREILEFGCGIGRNLKYFLQYFPETNIYGCDISAKSLDIANKENPGIKLFLLDSTEIEKNQNKFDLIFVSCVFHHINPAERKNTIKNIYNMLKKDGFVYIFEHNPYNPVTRYIVNTCPWDSDAILLNMKETTELVKYAGLEIMEKKYALFFPALLRTLSPLENYLRKIPMGGQYYVKGIKKD